MKTMILPKYRRLWDYIYNERHGALKQNARVYIHIHSNILAIRE